MTATSPTNFVEQGKKLPKDLMGKVKAVNLATSNNDALKCSKSIFVGIFFDGTNNNRNADYVHIKDNNKRKHSNIVRLYHTFPNKPSAGYFPIYIPGVGTAFPEINDTNKYIFTNKGSAFAEKGEHRILWGLIQLINAPWQYLSKAKLISDKDAKTLVEILAKAYLGKLLPLSAQAEILENKIKTIKNPCIEKINISVFGFSRGAAQARVFVNWLFKICEYNKGKKQWTLAGIPINLQFLGIFDTVASVGLANLYENKIFTGHQAWASGSNLRIHPAIKQCVHFVAGHEVRACFPLDSVKRTNKTLPKNAIEMIFPGSHSDVGGGYAPGDLGVSPTPNSLVSIIPGKRMHDYACNAGVPLKKATKDLTASEKTIADFNHYMAATATATKGTIEKAGRTHMAYYFSFRFKHRNEFYRQAPYTNATNTHQKYLKTTQNNFISSLSKLPYISPYPPTPTHALKKDFDPVKSAEVAIKIPQWGKDKARHYTIAVALQIKPLDSAKIDNFLRDYIHDSMAGFIGMGMNEFNYNEFGLTKFRTVFKSR